MSATTKKTTKREKLQLLLSLVLPEGAKTKTIIDRVKQIVQTEFADASVKKAPASDK